MRALSQMTSPLRNSFAQTIVRPVRGYQRATFGRHRLASRSLPASQPRMPNTPSRVSARDAHMINESRRNCQSVLIDQFDRWLNEERGKERKESRTETFITVIVCASLQQFRKEVKIVQKNSSQFDPLDHSKIFAREFMFLPEKFFKCLTF